MTKRLKTRLDRTGSRLALQPLREDVVDAAFDRFRESGELPEDTRLAEAFTKRAIWPPSARTPPDSLSFFAAIERLRELAAQASDPNAETARSSCGSARRQLLFEAVHGDPLVRDISRAVLVCVVRSGTDVSDPSFLHDVEVPQFGCQGLHVIGFPERIVKPPHVRQARRLFTRLNDVRVRIDHDDPEWRDAIVSAIRGFRRNGTTPPPGIERDCVLIDGELHALIAHGLGRGDPDLIAAFDHAARGTPDERKRALRELSELIRAGRLFPHER